MPPAAEAAKTAAPPLRREFSLLLPRLVSRSQTLRVWLRETIPRHACVVRIGCGYVRLAMFEFKFPAVFVTRVVCTCVGRAS